MILALYMVLTYFWTEPFIFILYSKNIIHIFRDSVPHGSHMPAQYVNKMTSILKEKVLKVSVTVRVMVIIIITIIIIPIIMIIQIKRWWCTGGCDIANLNFLSHQFTLPTSFINLSYVIIIIMIIISMIMIIIMIMI